MVNRLPIRLLPTFVVVSLVEPCGHAAAPPPRRQLGFLQGCVDEAFFEPLPDDELERWG